MSSLRLSATGVRFLDRPVLLGGSAFLAEKAYWSAPSAPYQTP